MTNEETKTTTVPHEDLIAEHKIEISTLPEKTQKRIAKFNEETDDEKKEALDEIVCSDIWDYIETEEEKKKAEEKKIKHEELKKKTKEKAEVDVSGAATAENGKGKKGGEKDDVGGFMDRHFRKQKV